MQYSLRWLLLLTFVLGIAAPARAGKARTDPSDHAELFSKVAKEEVQSVLQDIQRLGKEFVIETFAQTPENAPEEAKARRTFFENWARDRARAEQVNGVYLLIYKEAGAGGYFELLVGNKTREKAFTETDRRELRERLVPQLKAQEFDKALIESATFVRDTMRTNLKGQSVSHRDEYAAANPGGASSDSGWMRWIWIGLAVVAGIWILRALMVALSGTAGGGGFLSALMGGLFGAMAGMWIYDSFFGGHTSSETGNDVAGGDGGSGEADTDYSGDGGGFDGGDSGGGDF